MVLIQQFCFLSKQEPVPFVFSVASLTPHIVLKIHLFCMLSMSLWHTNFIFFGYVTVWECLEHTVLYLNVWATMALFYTLGLLTYSSLNNVKVLLCWLVSVNLTQMRVTWEEGPQLEHYFHENGLRACLRDIFLIGTWCTRGILLGGGIETKVLDMLGSQGWCNGLKYAREELLPLSHLSSPYYLLLNY